MNHTQILFRLGLAVGAACAFSSCEVYQGGGGYAAGGYAPGGYVSDGGSDGGYYDDGPDEDYYEYRPSYTAFTVWGPSHSYYYGGHYYSHAWWNDNDYHRYVHNRDVWRSHHHSSNHHISSSSNHSSNSGHHGEPVKLTHYRENDLHRVPSGYHAPDYYKSHGISLKQNTHVDRSGDVHGRQVHSDNNHGNDHPSTGFSRYSHPVPQQGSQQGSHEDPKKKNHSSNDSDEHHKKKN